MSHPARESFRQFNNLDPQARLDEFHKRFDRLKSEFQSSQRPMFESATNRPFFNKHQWTGSNENPTSSNGQVPVEKTIPIHVQHERSRSEPVDNSSNVNQTGGSVPMNDRMHYQDPMHFMPDNSFFQHKFQHPFAEAEAASAETTEPRVHHIPIQVESRNATTGTSPFTKPVPANQQTSSGNVPSQSASNQANLNYTAQPSAPTSVNSDTNARPIRVIDVPVQITKSSSTPASSKKSENVFQQKSDSNINQDSTVIESSSDPALADPNKVYPMGYEPLPNNNNLTEKSTNEGAPKKETPFDCVKKILDDLQNYESQVNVFNGNNPSDKEYRYLDEMLTLCILRLDDINIDGNEELRKYRKSAINEVNRVAAILEAKVSKSKTVDSTEAPPDEALNQSAESNVEEKANLTDSKLDKKEAKKLEKAKAKKEKEEKEKAKKESGEKKEGKRIILFRGKNKNKATQNGSTSTATNESNDPSSMDVDPNNNDLKDDSTQSSSEQSSEVASTSSGSTLQGKETAV